MEKVKLEDVCKCNSSNISQKDIMILDGKYPVYGASGKIKNINFYKYDKPYIAIVKDGSGIGRTMLLPAKSSIISTMQYIIPNEDINIRYLYYAIKNMNLAKYCTGIAIPHIYYKDYKKEQLYLPKISEQIKITNIMDKIQNIIDLRKNQIQDLEELIKSKFAKMFGDVIKNEKGFKYKRIDEVSTIVTGTTPDTTNREFWNGNIKWITPAELNKDTFFVDDTQRKITENGRKSKSLLLMPVGTVLFTSRAPIGKTAIAGVDMCCNQGFKNCICSKEINNIYLYSVLKYNAEYLNSLGTGATFKELSKSKFSKIQISIPPIHLQNQFAEIVKQIDKQKFKLQKSLDEIEELQESLMNKYFG